MYDDIDNERDFWQDEPTRRLGRLPTGPVPRVQRSRQHLPIITTPARPKRRPADPFLVRLGLMLCIGMVMLPIAYTLRHGASDMLRTVPTGGATAVPVRSGSVQSTSTLAIEPLAAEVLVAETSQVAVLDAAASPTTVFDIDALAPAVPVNDVDGDVPATTQAPAQQKSAPAATAPAATAPATSPATTAVRTTVAAVAEVSTKTAACASSYEVASGDYWIVIADRVGVSLKDLLAANNATVKTPLYPGRDICLPPGASAPTAAAPPTTAAAKPTVTTAKPPATTAAPTTTTLPRRTYTAAEVESIIREVWPDDLEDEAVRIARRESNLQPTARNSCCIGLFQIYWSVHKGWLTAMGVTSADQLFDPRVNATAGFALYQRSGGWGPWAL